MAHVEIKGGRGGNGCISFEGSLLQFSVLSYHANISYIIVLAPGKKKPQGGNGGLGFINFKEMLHVKVKY